MRFTQPKLATFTLALLAATSSAVYATPAQHVIVAPNCLLQSIHTDLQVLSSSAEFSLINTNDAGIEQFIAAKAQRHAKPCGGFVDVTQAWNDYSKQKFNAGSAANFLASYTSLNEPLVAKKGAKYTIKYAAQVNPLLKTINEQDMWNDLSKLTSFKDRYAGSETGVKAANWIKSQVEEMAKANGRDDVTVYTIATGSQYQQPSVVAKIGNSNKPGVVIGGHMDTLSSKYEVKPGADDDGSGTVTVLEAARTVLSSGMHFQKPIYFIWYSAEEMGLVGSQYVVKEFTSKKIPVSDVIQLDMTGYEHNNDPTIWLITDYVNQGLTNYLEKLIKTYVKQPIARTECGYACSDHASWNQAGIKSSFPFEASFGNDDPYIHTSNDTMEKLSLGHMHDFAKLATAFAVELAEPVV